MKLRNNKRNINHKCNMQSVAKKWDGKMHYELSHYCRRLVTMFGDYRRNSSPSATFTPPRSRDRRKNSSAAMFTTRRNHSHGHKKNTYIVVLYIYFGLHFCKWAWQFIFLGVWHVT